MAEGEPPVSPAADWLNDDETTAARDRQAAVALDFAKLHLVFEQDPRAEALLKGWENDVVNTRIAPGSPIDAYARAEAVRAFVHTIRRQLNIAKTGKLA